MQYLSRHGDDFLLWAIYERGAGDSPPEVTWRAAPVTIVLTTEPPQRRCGYTASNGFEVLWLRSTGRAESGLVALLIVDHQLRLWLDRRRVPDN